MRSVGVLSTLDALAPGDHVCWVVDEPATYEELTRSCLDSGAPFNDKVMALGPEHTLEWARAGSRPVHTADPRVAFLDNGPLVADVMLETFRRETRVARDEGFRGLRVVADMDWLLAAAPAADDLLAFELRLDAVVAEVEATVVCAYRTTTFDREARHRMVSAHPLEFGGTGEHLGFRIWNAGEHVWRVAGEVDFANADAFRVAVAAVAEPGTLLCLRFDDLTFIDVAGMRAVAAVARDVPDVRLRFEATSPTFRRCWDVLAYGERLPSVEVL